MKASGVFVAQKLFARFFSRWSKKEDMDKKRKNWKGGRPKKIIKRQLVIGVRLTKEEHFIIKEKASKAGLARSRYLRETGIHGEVKMRLGEDDRERMDKLIGMSNNLNQLTKLAHQEGLFKMSFMLEDQRDKIDGLLNRMKRD